jgi:hypothetical protein
LRAVFQPPWRPKRFGGNWLLRPGPSNKAMVQGHRA